MKKSKASKTAETAAATRAYHTMWQTQHVFRDDYAVHFLGPIWKTIINSGFLSNLVIEKLLGSLRPVAGQVFVRNRYAEEALLRAIEKGVSQYIIVGAGYDTFSLRYPDLSDKLTIYELDHPETQKEKKKKLSNIDNHDSRNVQFIPVDFEHHAFTEKLTTNTFHQHEPVFYSWLGTTPYLSNDATLETLRLIADFSHPGSELVFDYIVPESSLESDKDRKVFTDLKAFASKRGDPLTGEFTPDEITQAVDQLGFDVLENLTPEIQGERYFKNRPDLLTPMPGSYLMHVRTR